MNTISFDNFSAVDMRVGVILSAEPVPETDKLLKLTVDLGEENPRQIVAGIAGRKEPEDIIGVRCVFVANLEPRTIRGVESQGMILVASDDVAFSFLEIADNVSLGTQIS